MDDDLTIYEVKRCSTCRNLAARPVDRVLELLDDAPAGSSSDAP